MRCNLRFDRAILTGRLRIIFIYCLLISNNCSKTVADTLSHAEALEGHNALPPDQRPLREKLPRTQGAELNRSLHKHRGLDNGIYYNTWTSVAGWWVWQRLPGATTDRCAAAVFGGNLHIVVKGLDGAIWHGRLFLPMRSWVGWKRISGATSSPPELAALDDGTALYLIVRGMDNRIYYRNFTWPGTWGDWTILPGATIDGPAAVVLGTNLQIVVKGLTSEMWHGYIDLTTGTWSGWSRLSGATPSTPELA